MATGRNSARAINVLTRFARNSWSGGASIPDVEAWFRAARRFSSALVRTPHRNWSVLPYSSRVIRTRIAYSRGVCTSDRPTDRASEWVTSVARRTVEITVRLVNRCNVQFTPRNGAACRRKGPLRCCANRADIKANHLLRGVHR